MINLKTLPCQWMISLKSLNLMECGCGGDTCHYEGKASYSYRESSRWDKSPVNDSLQNHQCFTFLPWEPVLSGSFHSPVTPMTNRIKSNLQKLRRPGQLVMMTGYLIFCSMKCLLVARHQSRLVFCQVKFAVIAAVRVWWLLTTSDLRVKRSVSLLFDEWLRPPCFQFFVCFVHSFIVAVLFVKLASFHRFTFL